MKTKSLPSEIISHIRIDDEGHLFFQSNAEHSAGVANLAKSFADSFGMPDWGYILGLLHDKGKEKRQFQEYIRDVNGIDGHSDYSKFGKAHSFVGGILAKNIYGKAFENFLSNQIISHHSGLHDYYDLERILKQDLPDEIRKYEDPLKLGKIPFSFARLQGTKCMTPDVHHLSRMLFSCLVDADYLDTEAFMDINTARLRKNSISLCELLPLLEKYIEILLKKCPDSEVNKIRKQVYNRCVDTSETEKGFYSLTVPTGGGKTLSSLIWAIRHALHNGMHRVIIAIPYTSIIAQTAYILKHIFGENAVLEHHSNFDPQSIRNSNLRHKAKLATENWDYPIIITTNVQLFESMFSNKPSDCRKLHNIVNSVIILDEVQTLPTDFLQPIVDSLKSYNNMFGVSVLFTTASQPLLSGIIEGCNPQTCFSGIENIREIIPRGFALHDKLRRVNIDFDNTGHSYDEIAQELIRHKIVLCIVNTRRDAQEIFKRLPNEGLTIHLSRMMYPKHVTQTIIKLKHALAENSDKVIRVIATQLIEAGVDIDFPVVYRQEAGLDSVLQAAGRCNREGKFDSATTHVFSLNKEHNLHGSIKDANNARLNLIDIRDWFAPETMTEYFRQLYCRKDTFDKKDIKTLLYNPAEMCFAEASKEFRLIEDTGKSVIVSTNTNAPLIQQLKETGITYQLIKQLSQYSITIHERDFRKLVSFGAIEEVSESLYILTDSAQYDENIGLKCDNHWMNEILMV